MESKETRLVWITMLAMADQDGVVEASMPGLAERAKVPLNDCLAAIKSFMAPDQWSRSKEHEGRRIEEVDGGWRLLNHGKYRDKMNKEEQREKARIRQERWRERQKAKLAKVGEAAYKMASNGGASEAQLNSLVTESLPEGLH